MSVLQMISPFFSVAGEVKLLKKNNKKNYRIKMKNRKYMRGRSHSLYEQFGKCI